MTRLALLLVPLVALAATLLGRTLSTGVAVVLSSSLGAAIAVLMWRFETDRVRGLADHMNTWLGRREADPVSLSGGGHWDALEIAVNAVGAAYERRGEKLARERPWRRDLVDSLVGPALLFAGDGRLVAANDDARRRFGIPDLGERPTLIQALGSATLARAARESLRTGRRVEVDATVSDRELRARCAVVGEEVLVVVTDRTQTRRTEEVRRDFVVNASHELKTPAAAIQTLSEALDVVADRDPTRVRAVAERLRAESERLVRIVHDLLDLGRLEAAGEVATVSVDLTALVRSVVASVVDETGRRGITVDLDLPERATVGGVAGDLRLVIDNLVRNAIQYNRDGGTVSVSLLPGDGAYELVVADSGIGIPQQDLPRIFERFYRVDEARSRETGGTGLGLSIVRHAVERHGGSVSVESLLGEGTTVRVRLPIAPAA